MLASIIITYLAGMSNGLVIDARDAVAAQADCGVNGYTKTTPAYYFDTTGRNATFAACSGLCKADTRCSTFGLSTTTCALLNMTVAADVYNLTTSPYRWYDKTCTTA